MSPLSVGLTVRVEGAVPEAPESTSQGWSLVPVKVSDPPPLLVMLKLAGAGLDAPPCPAKLKLAGLTLSTGACGLTVNVEEARLLVSAWLVALTVTVTDEETSGAVNNPDELIDPVVADHVTPGFGVLLTTATNCCVAPDMTVAFKGEVETLTGNTAAIVVRALSGPRASTASESRDRTRKWYVVPAASPPSPTEWVVTGAAASPLVLP